MEDKRAIIDELLTEARIYLDESVQMTISTIHEDETVPRNCLQCGETMQELYERCPTAVIDLIVCECEGCNMYYAFWIESPGFGFDFTPTWEDITRTAPLHGRKLKLPKETGQTNKKALYGLEDVKERLNSIIQDKLANLYTVGLSIETINSARNKVLNHLRYNCVTSKQLVQLLAAAVYEASHEDLAAGVDSTCKRVGERVSERQLEKIFGVTRKTIRKWKNILHGM